MLACTKGRVPTYCCASKQPTSRERGGGVAAAVSRVGKAADNLRRVVWDLLMQARVVSGDLQPSPDEPTKAERKAQEQRS